MRSPEGVGSPEQVTLPEGVESPVGVWAPEEAGSPGLGGRWELLPIHLQVLQCEPETESR